MSFLTSKLKIQIYITLNDLTDNTTYFFRIKKTLEIPSILDTNNKYIQDKYFYNTFFEGGNKIGIYNKDILESVTNIEEYFHIFFQKESDSIFNIELINRKDPYAHISFDDVNDCLQDLTKNSSIYSSLFDNDFFLF